DGQFRMHRPLIYQEADGRREEIAGAFRIVGEQKVGFILGPYDENRTLTIDPVLQYSTYIGGTQFDQAQAAALDSAGNAYLAGFTSSDDFPTVNPYRADRGPGQTAFVSKLNAAGTALVYSTYLGGDDNNAAFGIAVDAAGQAIITGQTTAADFPTLNAIQPTYGGVQDAFVTKLSADGASLVYSTYLGGTGGDEGTAIAVDCAGNAYVAGGSNSLDFPTLHSIRTPSESALPDIFVAKLTPAGAFVYSTYLGASAEDTAFGIAVDAAGSAYVAGQTSSPDFPVTPGAFDTTYAGGVLDGFVLKLNAAGSAIVYATYLGGSGFDTAAGVAVNTQHQAWVAGYTESADFPSAHPLRVGSAGLPDAFVVKLSATGGGLLSTYLGGSGGDSANAVAVDPAGNAYVTGGTGSADFPLVDAQQSTRGGAFDAYLTKLDPSGSRIVSSTYLGGSNDDIGIGIAANTTGVLVTGNTFSSDFPLMDPAQGIYAGGGDAFATRFGGLDLFLRVSGSAPVLLAASPTSTAYTFRDSGGVKFAGGNVWVPIGNWKADPTPAGTLSSLSSLKAWIGLKNSDDVGTRFDVRVQLRRNGMLISEGVTRCVQNVNRNPATSTAIAVPSGSFAPVVLVGSDELTLGVATRIGTNSNNGPCGGHANATGLRFYFDSIQQPSSFTAGLAP
ncbi:MAG TPA: SBBP repeat-containing protein, partial [Fimbriiglobus sp.]